MNGVSKSGVSLRSFRFSILKLTIALFCLTLCLSISSNAYAQTPAGWFETVFDPIDTALLNDEEVIDTSLNLGIFSNTYGLRCEINPRLLDLGDAGRFGCQLNCNYDFDSSNLISDLSVRYNLGLGGFGTISCGGGCVYENQVGNPVLFGEARYELRVGDFADIGDDFFCRMFEGCGFGCSANWDEQNGSEFDLQIFLGGFTF